MNRDATDVLSLDLDLARMDATAHLQAQSSHSFCNHHTALHGSCRAVEYGEKSITKRFDLTAAVAYKLFPNHLIVLCQQPVPAPITKLHRLLGRVHNIGKQHCCQN